MTSYLPSTNEVHDELIRQNFEYIENNCLFGSRGSGTLTWPGASQFSNNLVVPHGLNAVPTSVQATSQLPAGGAAVEMHWVSVDATNITFRGHTTDGSSPLATATTSFFWEAQL